MIIISATWLKHWSGNPAVLGSGWQPIRSWIRQHRLQRIRTIKLFTTVSAESPSILKIKGVYRYSLFNCPVFVDIWTFEGHPGIFSPSLYFANVYITAHASLSLNHVIDGLPTSGFYLIRTFVRWTNNPSHFLFNNICFWSPGRFGNWDRKIHQLVHFPKNITETTLTLFASCPDDPLIWNEKGSWGKKWN